MRKLFTLLLFFVITSTVGFSQVVSERYINFRELAAYEAQHPELFQPCPTCEKKEGDRWSGLYNPNMPVPVGGNIKHPPQTVQRDVPMAPSRPPAQTWLGHLDVGSIIPPDSHGAIGLNHVITATNNFIRIHNKVGGAMISQVTISAFTGVSSTCDPYMKFDPTTQRWIFSAIGCGAATNNLMVLMVSNTSDPTGTWRTITWIPSGGPMFLDHPYTGFDDRWIVISGRRFQSGVSFVGSSLFIVDKTDMLNGTPITFGTNAQQIDKTSADGDCPLPVTVYYPPFSTVGNPSPGTFYVLQSWGSTSIRLTTVTGNLPSASWNTASAVFPSDAANPWNAGNLGNFVEQAPPETRRLSANDARISSAMMMNGKIWAVHHIGLPSAGSDRVAVQWWQLEGTPGAGFGNIIQKGRVGGTQPNTYKWFPSIAVNIDEDVLIGYTSSSNTMRVSAGYATRQASTPLNTTDDELVYKTGLDRYWKDFNSGRARWGDYSHTALDPADQSLWTIQEYADVAAGPIPPDNNSRFGTWWAQVARSAPPIGFGFNSPPPATSPCPAGPSMSITLGTTSIGGYNQPINLAASGNPPGTTVTFSPNPVTPGNSTVVTLNGTNTLSFGSYTVTITGTATGVPPQTKDLVYQINPGTGPSIVTHPTSQTVCAGTPVTFSVSATGATSYQWQVSTNGGSSWSDIAGATGTSYTIASPNGAMSSNQYRAVARGQCNNTPSNAAVLIVNTAPSISSQPQNATICAGSNHTFSVGAGGTGITYQWQLSTNGGGTWNDIPGATASTYTVTSATTAMSGNQYRVNLGGTCPPPASSTAATLTVVSPATVSQHPANSTICEPATTSTSFTATGTGSGVIYQWQESTNGGASWNNVVNGGVYSGATTSTLTLSNIPPSMNGYQYRALVSNATCTAPAASNAATLTVNLQPAVTSDPNSATICAGSNNTFTVGATGSGLTYQWQVSTDGGANYSNITGANSASYTVTGTTPAFNNNRYRVVVSGSCTPSVTSSPATLTVHTPISISSQPAAPSVCATGSTSISVTASGTGPTYQWQVSTDGGSNWTAVTNGSVYSGATTPTLSIGNVTTAMNGYVYRVVITGTAPCGAVTSNSTALNVTPQPVISASGPTSLLPGRSTTLSVNVTPAPNLTFAWYLNGNLISGATGNSVVATVTELGNYRVIVTNTSPGGTSCTSELFNVKDSVSTRFFIFPSPNSGRYTVSYYNTGGTTKTRSVTVYDSKGSQVYNGRFSVTGPYTLLNIDMRDAQSGVYYVVLRDAGGKEIARGKVMVQHR
ncbi:MAG TPA: T9SS type A sorting domain-containing protein [Chitinophagaceae bacterium]|nr:T9SS type A sorting domain-containing protein [Chitinophagaceae bacterium]